MMFSHFQRPHTVKSYPLTPHQPYLEYNSNYRCLSPDSSDPLYNLVWEVYEVNNFNIEKSVALPDVCADIMCFYTPSKLYCYFMGGNLDLRFMDRLAFCKNAITIFGVKIYPGALGNLADISTTEINSEPLLVSEIFQNGRALVSMLEETSDFESRWQVMRTYLLQRIAWNHQIDPLTHYLTRSIITNCGQHRVLDLAADTGYSDRYLRKKLQQSLGISLKSFSDVIRFQYSYQLYQKSNGNFSLANLAAQSGYYDQSHMNATYKRLTGALPKDILTLYHK